MENSEQEIAIFTTQVRQLLLKYKEMRQELVSIKEQLAGQKKDAQDMETLANAAIHDYDMLKAARMLEVSDGDIETSRKRINKLIRDVDRCITLLNEQQTQL